MKNIVFWELSPYSVLEIYNSDDITATGQSPQGAVVPMEEEEEEEGGGGEEGGSEEGGGGEEEENGGGGEEEEKEEEEDKEEEEEKEEEEITASCFFPVDGRNSRTGFETNSTNYSP